MAPLHLSKANLVPKVVALAPIAVFAALCRSSAISAIWICPRFAHTPPGRWATARPKTPPARRETQQLLDRAPSGAIKLRHRVPHRRNHRQRCGNRSQNSRPIAPLAPERLDPRTARPQNGSAAKRFGRERLRQSFAKRLRGTVRLRLPGGRRVGPLGPPSSPSASTLSPPTSLIRPRRQPGRRVVPRLALLRRRSSRNPTSMRWAAFRGITSGWPFFWTTRAARAVSFAGGRRGASPGPGLSFTLTPPATPSSWTVRSGLQPPRADGRSTPVETASRNLRNLVARTGGEGGRVPRHRLSQGGAPGIMSTGTGPGTVGTTAGPSRGIALPTPLGSCRPTGSRFLPPLRPAPPPAWPWRPIARVAAGWPGASRGTPFAGATLVGGSFIFDAGRGLGVLLTHRLDMKLGLDDQSRLGRQEIQSLAEGSGGGRFGGLRDGHRGFGPGGIGGEDVLLDRFEFAGGRDVAGTAGGRLELHPAGLARAQADRCGDASRGPSDFPAQGTAPEPPDILIDPNSGALHRTHPSKTVRHDLESHGSMVTGPVMPGRVTAFEIGPPRAAITLPESHSLDQTPRPPLSDPVPKGGLQGVKRTRPQLGRARSPQRSPPPGRGEGPGEKIEKISGLPRTSRFETPFNRIPGDIP
jgi:hypothetical protein